MFVWRDFILTQIGVVVSEIQPNKLELAKRLKRYIGGTTFVEVLKAGEIFACSEKFLQSRFIALGYLQLLCIFL